jgi:2-dehydropantoate 2-reductase
MEPINTIAVLGAGALGAFFASKFFKMDTSCVSFVAKGERYDRLKEKGVVVNNKHYSISVMSPEGTSPPSDLIIVAVKHHHLQEAIPILKNRIGNDTIIISVMNGLDSEEYIGSIYGKEKVLYAVSVAIDAVREENRVTYTKEGKLLFGEAENSILTDRVKRVQAVFDRAGIVYETPADMIRILWWKFMINVGINQPSAVLRAPYGVFQTSQDAQAIMESAMKEVIAIAKAANVNVSEEDLTDWYPLLASLSPQGKTSMFQDIEARRKTEVEMFAGKVVELGATYGIPTPVNQTLLRMIKVIEEYPIS